MIKTTFPKLLTFAFIITVPHCANKASEKDTLNNADTSAVSERLATQAEINEFFRNDSLSAKIETKKVYKINNNLYVNSTVQKRSPDLPGVDTIAVDTVGLATKVYQIPLGQREHFTLPGGVDVQADAGTTIIAGQNLEINPLITIDGRAIFQTERRKHPIIVAIGDIKIYLKSGILDVMTFKEEPYFYVSVTKGTAEIMSRKYIASLTKGFYAKWVCGIDSIHINQWDAAKYTPWQADFFNANDYSSSVFFNTLQRWYKTPIIFGGNPDKFDFNGKISVSASMKNFVTLMAANNWKAEYWISHDKFSIIIKE